MSGFIVELLDEVPKSELSEMSVESSLLNRFVVGLREGLAKLNDTLHD